MTKRRNRAGVLAIAVAAVLAALALPAAAEATTQVYSFDADAQGWTVAQNGGQTPAGWNSTGGNPGGYIVGQDTVAETGCPLAPCDFLFLQAPPVQPGTFANNYGGTWSFDFGSNAAPTDGPYGRLLISDPAGNQLFFKFVTPGIWFQHISGSLTSPGWGYCTPSAVCGPATEQQFKSVLGSATYVDILADVDAAGVSGESYVLDNFRLNDPASRRLAAKRRCKKHKRLVKIHGKRKCVKKKKKKKK